MGAPIYDPATNTWKNADGTPASTGIGGWANGTAQPIDAGLTSDAWNGAKSAAGVVTGLATPSSVDTSALKNAQQRAADTQDFYRKRLVDLPPAYNPGHSAQLFDEGQGAIADLTAASKGLVPSAAELQLHQQAARNAANAFGMAAALGGRTPGGALRSAQMAATNTQGDANAQAAQLRAQEQAQARAALVQAIGNQQQSEQGLRTGDIQQTGQLIQADTSALDSNAKAAAAVADANAKKAAADDAFKGQIFGGFARGAAGGS
jgi:hypothetical protein